MSTTDSPLIYLAIDNCFASRRWTAPGNWAAVIRDLGISYVEASADNECDPLYSTPDYLVDWVTEVQSAFAQTGVKVANLYSGHGTYATTGLAHADVRIRDRILNDWLKVMAKTAGQLEAGLGFACHAFSEPVLQDPVQYAAAEEDLYNRLAELAVYARQNGTQGIGLEQMYSPHMVPWTITGTFKMLGEVYRRGGQPFYLTIDTGHMCGQRKFIRPDLARLSELAFQIQYDAPLSGAWLGPRSIYDRMYALKELPENERTQALLQIDEELERYPYLFASSEDGDPYRWLEELGCYSPIIHLQQTTGLASAHLPFTKQTNATGIIEPGKVLRAITKSYLTPLQPGMPPRCKAIYLTIEVFAGTADLPVDILARLRETVAYWRQWLPQDGLPLDELAGKPSS